MAVSAKMQDKKVKPPARPGAPRITKCSMAECVYNIGRLCRAKYIYIGDDHQKCDDYSVTGNKIDENRIIGYVGSCLVKKCVFNNNELCGAESITVSRHKDHADCGMYNKI
jgi:hypothetical protein